MISSEEERVLIKAVKEKGTDCDEMKQLEHANMPFVVSLISHYQHRGLTLEELIESGKAGLRIAMKNYDLDSDSKFIAYAVTQMRQSIEELMTLNCTKNESWGNTKGE